MKMAKATEADLKVSLALAGVLEDIDNGFYPRDVALGAQGGEPDDGEDESLVHFDPDDPKHLRALYDRLKYCLRAAPGGVARVLYGMDVLLDPTNAIVDPGVTHLALHPRIEAALAGAAK
ncbi:MAG: hypothetical protein K2X64_07310 [Rhodocyclaceae bacterium]|nr:hypothetical protein [Rhodocyclaceae bacterium]